jgi:hypothetical protein
VVREPQEFRRCSRATEESHHQWTPCHRVFIAREPTNVSERNWWCDKCIAEVENPYKLEQEKLAAEYAEQCRKDAE